MLKSRLTESGAAAGHGSTLACPLLRSLRVAEYIGHLHAECYAPKHHPVSVHVPPAAVSYSESSQPINLS